MGTIKKGILGGFSGTVGTVVGSTWRGMDVIRSRPKSSSSNPTPLQLMQREKFALAIKFQNSLRAMQSRLYGENVIAYENGQAKLLMDKVIVTKGTLTGFQNLTVTAAAAQTLNFTWEDNSSQIMAKATDIFCTAVYEEESAEFVIREGPEQRPSANAAVVLPALWSGKTVHIYAFYQTFEQDAACNSFYLGTAVVQ